MLERGCAFCEILAGTAPADIICRGPHAVAFAPLEPAARGHALVIPATHVTSFLSADVEVLSEVTRVSQLVARAISKALNPDGFNLITSAGHAATQSIFHLHIHVVPRWEGDRMGDIWPPTTPYLEGVQDEDVSLIREAVNDPLRDVADHKGGQEPDEGQGNVEAP